MSQYIVVGHSPFSDTSIASGPFRSLDTASQADQELLYRGWNTEIIELVPATEQGFVNNEDGE